jgi:hypothetical protein
VRRRSQRCIIAVGDAIHSLLVGGATLLASPFVLSGPAQGAPALGVTAPASVGRTTRSSEHLLAASRLAACEDPTCSDVDDPVRLAS